MSRLVILTGPSCSGKSPLLRALRRFNPELADSLRQLVLYTDRDPRPGEREGVDYYFRPRADIEALRGKPGVIVQAVRRDLQALEVSQVTDLLAAGQQPLFEGNPYIARALQQTPELAGVAQVSCFLSPLSLAEIQYLQAQPTADLRHLVTDVMRRKLLRRTQRQKGILSAPDLADIEARCGAAYDELAYAPACDWVFPNHDGEDSENWDAFYYPLGDARQCLLDLAALLTGAAPAHAEKWPPELFA